MKINLGEQARGESKKNYSGSAALLFKTKKTEFAHTIYPSLALMRTAEEKFKKENDELFEPFRNRSENNERKERRKNFVHATTTPIGDRTVWDGLEVFYRDGESRKITNKRALGGIEQQIEEGSVIGYKSFVKKGAVRRATGRKAEIKDDKYWVYETVQWEIMILENENRREYEEMSREEGFVEEVSEFEERWDNTTN